MNGIGPEIVRFVVRRKWGLKGKKGYYYYRKCYQVLSVGNIDSLIMKRVNENDPIIIIVAMKDFYQKLLEVHKAIGDGGRVKMISALKNKMEKKNVEGRTSVDVKHFLLFRGKIKTEP